MNLIRVTKTYFDVWTELALELWPNEDPEEMREVLIAEYEKPNIRAWLAMENEEYIGFINASLRSDYVPGCEENSVGYVEGIYLRTKWRGKGYSRHLLKVAEDWARENGCTEMGSDALLENTASHAFHQSVGFTEVERVVCFYKSLEE
ncbi:MAG: aminoglycoside 6'-N-acetyltransferase [Calditrichota bacterium]